MKFGKLMKAAVAASLLAGSAAQAAPSYFFGNLTTAGEVLPACSDTSAPDCAPAAARALFLEAVAVTLNESFESRAVGSLNGDDYGNSNQMTVFESGNILRQAPPTAFGITGKVSEANSLTAGLGRFNTTPPTADVSKPGRWFETGMSFTIDLATEVGALAFYGTDHGDFRGGLSIGLFNVDSDGKESSVLNNAYTLDSEGTALPTSSGGLNGSLLFFGFASESKFNRIKFNVTQSSAIDYLGFDDLMVGNLRTTVPPSPVPEPGSLALAGLALLAAGWARKTQRRA